MWQLMKAKASRKQKAKKTGAFIVYPFTHEKYNENCKGLYKPRNKFVLIKTEVEAKRHERS